MLSFLSLKLASILSPVLYLIMISYLARGNFGLSSEYFSRKWIASDTVFITDSWPCRGRIIILSMNRETELVRAAKNPLTSFLFSFINSLATSDLSGNFFQLSIFFLKSVSAVFSSNETSIPNFLNALITVSYGKYKTVNPLDFNWLNAPEVKTPAKTTHTKGAEL
jgi:hypothetical protein